MASRYIIFVEDDPKIVDLMEIAVGHWNAANSEVNRHFVIETCANADDAKIALERTRYDAALFDIRLPGVEVKGKATTPLGNELALHALEKLGIPTAIMSGNPNDVDDRLRGFPTVRVFFKGDADAYDGAVAWFAEWWEMMSVIANSQQRIQASSAEVFVKRLWPQWKDFAALGQTDGKGTLLDVVTRQYVSHVAELLGLDGPDEIKWHPFETYVVPSLWSHRAHTGDIFALGDDLRIVLTPQCDMANGNVENVLLAHCKRGAVDWESSIDKLKAADTDERKEKAGRYFRKMVNQQLGASQHFLAPLPGEKEPILVDFSKIEAMALIDLNKMLDKRLASVSASFLANLTQRFGSYVSRIGQPNIDVAHFCD